MANTIREQAQIGLVPETTWGTAPSGNALRIPVNPGAWLHDVVESFDDDAVRNILARTFRRTPTVAHGEGSVGGPFYPIEGGYFLDGVLGGSQGAPTILQKAAAGGATTFYGHEFVIGQDARSYAIQQSDSILTELLLGMMPVSYTLRWNAGEGAVEYETEMMGKGRVWPTTSKTFANHAASVIPQRSLVGSMVMVAIAGAAVNKVLSMEMVFSREVEMGYGAGNRRRPNIRRSSVPKITFRAVVELQTAADIKKYSESLGDNADAQASAVVHADSDTDKDFGTAANLETWHVRIATPRDVAVTDNPLPTAAMSVTTGTATTHIGDKLSDATNGADTGDDGVLDIFLDKVSYAEAPIEINRSERTATFEFHGEALYDNTDSRIGVFRLYNKKTTVYTAIT